MPADQTRAPKLVDRVFDSATTVTRVYEDENGERIIEGIASTPSTDRMGDQVNPQGVKFQLPLPLLWQHDPERACGNVIAAEVRPEGIKFRAALAPAGTLSAIDSHWQELKAGLVRFVSVGFRSLKSSAIKTGLRFDEWEWLELSCVTIPANPDAAITTVRAFAPPQRDALPPKPAGIPAAPIVARSGPKTMSLAERIKARKQRLDELKSQLTDVVSGEDLTPEAKAQADELTRQIDEETGELETLERAQASIEMRAVAVQQGNRSPAIMTTGTRTAERPRPKADLLVKAVSAQFMSYCTRRPVEECAKEMFTDDQHLQGYMQAIIAKAASNPAMTTVPAWAGALVQDTWTEFLELLQQVSVYAALARLGTNLNFDGKGRIIIPSRDTSKALAGDFIGEGEPIPVKQGALTSAPMTPKKLAVITTFTREMARATSGQIQAYVRQWIVEDTAKVLDTRLLDALPATAVRPAGLLNGVTPIVGAGSDLVDIVADFRNIMASLLVNGQGMRLVWLLNPVDALSLGLLTNAAGFFVFGPELENDRLLRQSVIVSNNVAAGTMILLDVSAFVTASDPTPEFMVSEEATLHMEDTTPLPINGGTPASPVRSLFQTATIGVRMIQEMNWALVRPNSIAALTFDWTVPSP